MLELTHEMTFRERIEGPLGPTESSPPRLCWQIAEATLSGPRIAAKLAMPGLDWIRVEPDGTRRQDQRAQFLTDDGVAILMRYDAAIIRADPGFAAALAAGEETAFGAQYMCMAPLFDVADPEYGWLTHNLFVARGRLAGPREIEYEIHRLV
ncbi:MAG: DUF3237 domain-containing protein [Actinobacteria bacterium]|nr:DUF3237 domain-containing protein [Actinomycetota bacterium]